MLRLIINNTDYLVTVDQSRRIIRDGALVIQDGRIVAVGKTAEFPPSPGDDVIDGRGKLALPGVFDTHVHNSQQLGRSCGVKLIRGRSGYFAGYGQSRLTWTKAMRFARLGLLSLR